MAACTPCLAVPAGDLRVCAQYIFSIAVIDSGWLAAVRMTIAGILMLGAGLIIYGPKEVTRIFHNKKDLIRLIIFGLAGLMFVQYTYFTAIQLTNAGTATTLQYTCPIMVMVYSCIRNKRAPGIYGVISIILVVVGVFLLACHGDVSNLAISPAGLFWGLISAVAMACYTILPGDLISRYGNLMINGYGLLIGGVVLGVIFRVWNIEVYLDWRGYLAVAAVILVGCIMANMIYLQGVSYIGPMKATLFVSVEPVSAAFFALVWMHTPLGLPDLLGIACVVSAVLLYNIKSKQ